MKFIKKVSLIFIPILLLQVALSQVADKKSLTLEGAEKAITAAKSEAVKLHAPGGVIAVVDDGGNLMALARLDGTFSAGANISIGKARTAAMFKKPTKFFEDVIKNGRTAMTALQDFTPLQGGVPIVIEGQIVGAIGVSGAASAQQDEELALAGAAALQNPTQTEQKSVKFFPAAQVETSFDKGAVLDDGKGEDYMIHTSKRVMPGMAEVHLKDADLIRVVDGEATFVTGGKVIEPKTIAQDEVRGSSIENGEIRTISKGDVIIVPAGVPHWFKEVKGTLHYYVVKVR